VLYFLLKSNSNTCIYPDCDPYYQNENCDPGYYGKDCENTFKSCPGDCQGNGSCNTVTGVCSCNAGYSGAGCEIPYMLCDRNTSSPCPCPDKYKDSHGLENPGYLTSDNKMCKDIKPLLGAGYVPSMELQPAKVLVLRHGDRYYCDVPPGDAPPCAAAYEVKDDNQNTNCVSDVGIKRAWRTGQWIDCYAKKNNLKISVIASQCGDQNTNARPNSTASVIAESLKKQSTSHDFCVMTFNKQYKNSVLLALSDPRFAGTLAVIVWDHGAIPHILSVLAGKDTKMRKQEEGCYDTVFELDTLSKEVFVYKMATLGLDEACSTACSDGKHLVECNAYNLEKQI